MADKMLRIAGRDIIDGKAKALSVVKDDEGNGVLRIVDAAPYIVEISRFSTVRHKSVNVGGSSINLLALNANRKYALIRNFSNKNMFLALGATAELNKGIVLFPNEQYEISAMKGNLYKGDINAICDMTETNLFNKDIIVQGGVLGSSGFSTNPARTRAHPIPVTAGKTYRVSIVHETIRIRNIYAYTDMTTQRGTGIMGDNLRTEVTFTIPAGYVAISISFAKTDITEYLTPEETKQADIRLVELDSPILVTEGE